jgi:hypothetical protein
MGFRFRAQVAAIALIAVGIAAAPAAAEDASDDDAGWHFHLTPYLWLASLKGDMATLSGLPKVDVDASFDDILDQTDFAFMLAGEARYDRDGLLVDASYMELSLDEETRGPFFSGVDLEADSFFMTVAGFYRVLEEKRLAVDLLAGARVWYIDTILEFKPGILAERRASDDEAWVDPVVGARGSVRLLGPLFASAGADIGGFGSASDLTWQVIGTLDVRPFDWLAVRAGYRHLDVDYDHGGYVWDIAMSGPILGATIQF